MFFGFLIPLFPEKNVKRHNYCTKGQGLRFGILRVGWWLYGLTMQKNNRDLSIKDGNLCIKHGCQTMLKHHTSSF